MAITLDGTNGITTETGTGDVSVGDDLIFTGTGNRITGDFSNATLANRVAFQSSTTNGDTAVASLPNGTSTSAYIMAYNNSAPTNASYLAVFAGSAFAALDCGKTGSGSYLPLTTYVGGSERMRIDTSGNLLVGTTTQLGAAKFTMQFDGAANNGACFRDTKTAAGTDDMFIFQRGTTQVGSISTTTSSTAYNTSSDYRLKENVQPMTGALATVAQLKPCTYTWKVDGSAGQGFIAHELQAVVPDCVTGEKDAVDADGNPQYQGVDTSFLVATLTAAIKEQQTIIESLQARIEALENNNV